MDVSGSMTATDVSPTRLAAAKQAANDFVDQLPPTVRVGLVAFSTAPRVLVEATTDRAAVHAAIDGLAARGGTALGDAIAASLEAAGLDPGTPTTPGSSADPGASADPAAPSEAPAASNPAPSADPDAPAPVVATVLLSDGANSVGALEPIPAAELAAALDVPIYTIALGTAGGTVTVPDELGQPHVVNVPPDTETLAAIAELTGGRAFEAPTAADLAQIYDSLGSRIGYTTETREVTQWFAAAGLLLVVAGAGLAAHWFNRFP
jgi:Ca-activated chloride channel family protein